MITAKRLREHAEFLKEKASEYREEAINGLPSWREHDAMEAFRLENAAAFYAVWAEQRAAREQEEAEDDAS